jgi:hypothetical protein
MIKAKKKLPRRKKRANRQPGPKPDLLKIDMNWQEAMKKAIDKKKPADGWPK